MKPESSHPATETADAPPEAEVQNDAEEAHDSTPASNTRTSSVPAAGAELPLSSHNLVSNVSISPVTATTLPQFRRIITLLLPVPYSDKFFHEILRDDVVSSLTLAALWFDGPSSTPRVVSGIRCRLLAQSPTVAQPSSSAATAAAAAATALGFFQAAPSSAEEGEKPSLYVSTIATLAPYRGHGIATELLRQVTARAIDDYGVATVTAHVWEANEEAREWYAKLGFLEVKREPEYYRRLRPMGAWLLERKVCPSDLLGGKGPLESAVV